MRVTKDRGLILDIVAAALVARAEAARLRMKAQHFRADVKETGEQGAEARRQHTTRSVNAGIDKE